MWESQPLGIVLPPQFGKKKRDDGCTLGLTGALSGRPSGTSSLKEGTRVAIGEKTPQRKPDPEEDEAKCIPRYACRLFGTNSLKEGAM
jgi:hypothetical protein